MIRIKTYTLTEEQEKQLAAHVVSLLHSAGFRVETHDQAIAGLVSAKKPSMRDLASLTDLVVDTTPLGKRHG